MIGGAPNGSVLPPYLGLFFLMSALIAGGGAVLVDRYESLAARAEIARSHLVLARIIGFTVESADYRTRSGSAPSRVERDLYRLRLAFTGSEGMPQSAELEWFHPRAIGGLPVHREPPWVGGLEALAQQPVVRIYQNRSDPAQVRLAAPLEWLATGSEIDPGRETFDLLQLVTFSLLTALLLSILYGVGYRLWRVWHE